MKRAVLVLGSAGVGKSTLINCLLDSKNATTVSDDMWADGTADIKVFPTKTSSLFLMDTPGLDSVNCSSEITEKVQNGYSEMSLLIVLVLERTCGRVTKWLKNFRTIKQDLVGDDASICIIWTKAGVVSEINQLSTRERFPSAAIFEDSDLKGILDHFNNSSHFKVQKVTKAKAKVALTPLAKSEVKKTSSAPAAQPKSKKPQAPSGPPIGLPVFLDTLSGYKLRATKDIKVDFQDLTKQLLVIKAAGGVEYQVLRHCGDATLEFTVLSTLSANNKHADLRTKAELITRNDGAMLQFFKEHILALHQAKFPNEEIGEHGEADVVEALLEYARRMRGKGQWVFKFIIVELFKLAGMGDLVHA